MLRLDYKREKDRWDINHKIEQKNKAIYLERLSEGDGLKTLEGLYQFVYNFGDTPPFKEQNKAKVELLIRVHSVFEKIKQ